MSNFLTKFNSSQQKYFLFLKINIYLIMNKFLRGKLLCDSGFKSESQETAGQK